MTRRFDADRRLARDLFDGWRGEPPITRAVEAALLVLAVAVFIAGVVGLVTG